MTHATHTSESLVWLQVHSPSVSLANVVCTWNDPSVYHNWKGCLRPTMTLSNGITRLVYVMYLDNRPFTLKSGVHLQTSRLHLSAALCVSIVRDKQIIWESSLWFSDAFYLISTYYYTRLVWTSLMWWCLTSVHLESALSQSASSLELCSLDTIMVVVPVCLLNMMCCFVFFFTKVVKT